jgi:hypothetical protein
MPATLASAKGRPKRQRKEGGRGKPENGRDAVEGDEEAPVEQIVQWRGRHLEEQERGQGEVEDEAVQARDGSFADQPSGERQVAAENEREEGESDLEERRHAWLPSGWLVGSGGKARPCASSRSRESHRGASTAVSRGWLPGRPRSPASLAARLARPMGHIYCLRMMMRVIAMAGRRAGASLADRPCAI